MRDNLHIIMILLKECNYGCRHCSTGSKPGLGGKIDTNLAIKILDDFSDFAQNKEYIASGGETTLHPGMRPILDIAKENHYITTAVTNGWWVDLQNPLLTEKNSKNSSLKKSKSHFQ